MIKLHLTIFLCLLLANVINAGIFPTEPIGKTVYVPKSKVTIKWKEDGNVAPPLKDLKTVTVSFMTGGDLNQVKLDTIGAVAATAKKINWIVPEVDPIGQWYFLKFSSGGNTFYTTRFTITDTKGKFPPQDPNPPPSGQNPGKVGKIIKAKDHKKPKATPTEPKNQDDDDPNKLVKNTTTTSSIVTPTAASGATTTTLVVSSSRQQLFSFTILLCLMITIFI
ncbi:520_t:CDS:2 [Entrophospora sp. SA101]|nr:5668_t:CDS:2 [Entrophospora sp. SA101]CAJ0849847.1 520_t:CDS:2 [Entrophospora sp. SA101]